MSDQVILQTSSEAASVQTVTGWVDRHGRFWGNDEDLARRMGCTHFQCDCGEIYSLVGGMGYCGPCREKRDRARYAAMPYAEWDGVTPVYSNTADRFFYDQSAVLEHIEENPGVDLELIICEPEYGRAIDDDYFEDELPEDYMLRDCPGVTAEMLQAIAALNELISKTVLSWTPGGYRTDAGVGESRE